MRSKQPKLHTIDFADARPPETATAFRSKHFDAFRESVSRGKHDPQEAADIHHTQAGLPLRGRPSQDRVRSVMYVRQDRQDSRDQQPHGPVHVGLLYRTLGSVAARESLRCLYQMIGVLRPQVHGKKYIPVGLQGRFARKQVREIKSRSPVSVIPVLASTLRSHVLRILSFRYRGSFCQSFSPAVLGLEKCRTSKSPYSGGKNNGLRIFFDQKFFFSVLHFPMSE